MNRSEIQTTGHAVSVDHAAEDAPVDVATLEAVTRLLGQLERTARAQRPIVIHSAPAPAPHPGVDVRMPVPPAPPAASAMPAVVDHPRNVWPLVFMVSGCTGLGAAAAAAATGSELAVLAVFGCFAAWGAAAYRLVFAR